MPARDIIGSGSRVGVRISPQEGRLNFQRRVPSLRCVVAAFLVLPVLAGRAGADGICTNGLSADPSEAASRFIFPNWVTVQTDRFDVWLCDSAVCTWGAGTETMRGLTVFNFGTATPSDLQTVYWRIQCGSGKSAVDTGLVAMTFAGTWAGTPAWTWAGVSADFTACAVAPLFSVPLRLYVDVDGCPTAGATVSLGIPGGGLSDEYGCVAPFETVISAAPKAITYIAKSRDKETAAPGDTVTYTLYYGRPGSTPLTSITVLETMPPYTTWNGVASTPPDPGWDPDTGPPKRLRWTIGGPLATGGGPTGAITFEVTVDWGNLPWDSTSGNVAAPEGTRLENTAHVSYTGTDCAVKGFTSNTPSVVVRRYMFWQLADNDILFAGRTGAPDDEVIYEITVRNVSSRKTWWNVNVWDTVPPELTVWGANLGAEDPCLGWTITPSGCAPAGAGRVVSGASTIMTWSLDLPPGATISLRWKAKVNAATAPPDSTAINTASIMATGFNGVNGTGHAGRAREWNHLARVVLRTTYISYLAWSGSDGAQAGISIMFYPLHKAANFELRALEYDNTFPYSNVGGKSASIGAFMGTCLGGFGACGAVTAGCGVQRTPATYLDWRSPNCAICDPATIGSPPEPAHFLYKLVSNSPILWSLYSAIRNTPQDQTAFTPSSSLSFSGFIHYTYRREAVSLGNPEDGDSLNIINTSINANDVLDPDLATTVLIFTWDVAMRVWRFYEMVEIDKESQYAHGPVSALHPCGHYRIVSSDARLLIRQSNAFWGICTGNANSGSNLSPTRETGVLVSKAVGDTFYVFPTSNTGGDEEVVIIGNLGAADVDYRIDRYQPKDIFNSGACIPLWMADTSGTWSAVRQDTVPWTAMPAANPANAHVYGTDYDNAYLFPTANQQGGIWRVVQLTPGALQVYTGGRVGSAYAGGSMLHDDDGIMVGDEFWLFFAGTYDGSCKGSGGHYALDWIEVFCPKAGTAVTCVSDDGYAATYTSDGPDQCIAFGTFTNLAAGQKRAIRVTGTENNLTAMHNQCVGNHKFFTAPFVAKGVHYDILAPPVVYIGQSFWITVVAVEAAGGTKTDYCATSGFTSTDPGARIDGSDLGTYSYVWDSDDPVAACVGAGCVDLCDNGVAIMVNVVMTALGPQTITAFDFVDGSITGLGTIMVVGVDVKLEKRPRFSTAASGDTVQFRVCWSNYSSATAFDFVITDAVPQGTDYVPDLAVDMMCGTSAPAPAVDVAWSTDTTSPPGDATFTTLGAGQPPTTTRWLRWTVQDVFVNTTGCVCYRVEVQ